jgi:hypothetical protein
MHALLVAATGRSPWLRATVALVAVLAIACSGPSAAPKTPDQAALRSGVDSAAWYDQFLTQMRTTGLTVTNREVYLGGEWATEVAGFEWALVPVTGGPPVTDRGSYMQVWHREPDGRWLFSREVWNSSASLPSSGKGQ